MSNLSQFRTVIKSVQRGVIVLASVATNAATITGVDTSKTFISYLGHSVNDDLLTSDSQLKVVLTNATTVTASRSGNTSTPTLSFEAIEYY